MSERGREAEEDGGHLLWICLKKKKTDGHNMFKKNKRWEDTLTRKVILTLWEKSLKGNRLEYFYVGNHQRVGRRKITCESRKAAKEEERQQDQKTEGWMVKTPSELNGNLNAVTESSLTSFTEQMHPAVLVSDVAALVRYLVTVNDVFNLLAQPCPNLVLVLKRT